MTNKGLEQSTSEVALISRAGQSRVQVTGDTTLGELLHHHAHVTTFETARRVNRGAVLLEHRTFSQREVLKHRMKMIAENASIIVTCDHSPLNNERPQFTGR
ncbi:hypothetical protein TNCV_1867611 [Trichonephila clavipes]|nr:hypothetical protein TNCV_1867611 [Trichonephila clavipes]